MLALGVEGGVGERIALPVLRASCLLSGIKLKLRVFTLFLILFRLATQVACRGSATKFSLLVLMAQRKTIQQFVYTTRTYREVYRIHQLG